MNMPLPKQLPLAHKPAHKTELRTQFGALPYRIHNGKTQILLVTTRGSGRWIVPKGWPMAGVRPAKAAQTEAWEEAGIKGKGFDHCLGLYSYSKKMHKSRSLTCVVMVYPVLVRQLAPNFPEKKERRRKWFSRAKAAAKVREPELAKIIETFNPRLLR